MKTFFKGNSFLKGMMSVWSFNSKEKSIFLRMVRQTSWDEEARKPGFKGGRSIVVKFGITEAFGIIAALKGLREWSFFHSFKDETTSGGMKSMTPSKGEGKNAVFRYMFLKKNNESFSTTYTLNEADELANFLLFAISHCNDAIYSDAKKRAEEYKKNKAVKQNEILNNDEVQENNAIQESKDVFLEEEEEEGQGLVL